MKKLLLAGLLIGSFAFGQQITVKKGSYCTGFSSIGGDFGNATGEHLDFTILVILTEQSIKMLL